MKVKHLIETLNDLSQYDPEDSVIVGIWGRDEFTQVDNESDWHDLADDANMYADWSKQTDELQSYANKWLIMSKVLTKEIADEWIADEDSHDLCEFEAIDDAAAESLSKHEGYLYLNSLKELSDAAAESLGKHKGDYDLGLEGLTKLSDAAAESLSKHKGGLDFFCLTELSDAAAESLSKHKGTLILYGLTELSDAAVESLSKHKGEIDYMDPKEWAEEFRANQ